MAMLSPEYPFVYFWGKPRSPLQTEVFNGLREHMLEMGATIQKEPTMDTNLIVTPARMSEDVPLQKMVLLRLRHKVDKFQAKVMSVSTIDRFPGDISDIEPDHLSKVLDVLNRSRKELYELAQARELSPIVAIGYPQIPRVGCSFALIVEGDKNSKTPRAAYLIGLEQSHPEIGVNGRFYTDIFDKIAPQATAQMAISNKVRKDITLPHGLWLKSEAPEAVILAGKRMQELRMYPPSFPYRNFVSRIKVRFYDFFLQLTGLSFGNTSMRAQGKESEYGKFWMSKSGAKKDDLKKTEVYLAGGLIPGTNDMGRIPIEDVKQDGRMSVDSTEIEQIYDAFPDVSVTSHGHVWIMDPDTSEPLKLFEGYKKIGDSYVVCSRVQYPCGSVNLGKEAVDAAQESPDPSKTIVLQRRHGMHGLGSNYEEMFDRFQSLREQNLMTAGIPQD